MPEPIINTESTIITRSAIVTPKSFNEKDRSFAVVASTEVAVKRWMGGEIVDEVLSVKGWDITPETKVPLLDCHSYWRTADVKGSAVEFKNDNELTCRIEFSAVAENEYILAREGHLDSVSVGYDILEYYYVKSGETIIIEGRSYTAGDRPMIIGTKIHLRELSLVPLGADEFAKIRTLDHAVRMANNTEIPKTHIEGERTMPKELEKPEGTETKPTVVPVDETAIRTAATKAGAEAERKRIADINASCRELNVSIEFSDKLIADGISFDDAQRSIVKEAVKNFPVAKPTVKVGLDSVDNLRSGLTLVAQRSIAGNISKEEQTSLAKSEFNGIRGPIGLAKAILESYGVRTTYMNNSEIYDAVRIQGLADFLYVTQTAGTKHLTSVFEQNIVTINDWTDEVDVSDFNTHDFFDITPLGLIPVVADKAVVTLATIGEYAESGKLATNAIAISLSRQAFISDSFGAFGNLAAMYGESYGQTMESLVYAKLIANGVLKDTKALFHVDHANLGAGLLTPANLDLGKVALRTMVQGANKIGMPAQFLIVPEQLRMTAETIVYSLANMGTVQDYNTFRQLKVVSSPYITDVNDWYLAGAKGKTISRLFLNGQRSPTLSIDEARALEALGFTYKIVFDAGVVVRSPFYLYKSVNA